MQLVIDRRGQIRCLYSEEIDLHALGTLAIHRASHVDPDGEGWLADLAPVGGPRLGPYRHRSEALQAELAWLSEHLLQLKCPHANGRSAQCPRRDYVLHNNL